LYLEDLNAVLDCMRYVELNAVRAGLVKRPETWKGSSCYLREINVRFRLRRRQKKTKEQRLKIKDQRKFNQSAWLVPLEMILGGNNKEALIHYRSLLYYRGAVPTKEGHPLDFLNGICLHSAER
jgi:hypothetical protein